MKARTAMDEMGGLPAGPEGAPLLRTVLSTAVDQAILAVDPTCRVTVANGGAERLLGSRSGTLVGRHLATFLLPDADGTELTGFDQLLTAGGGPDALRMRTLVRDDGTEIEVLLSIGVLRDDPYEPRAAVLVAWAVHGEQRAAEGMRRAFEREHSAAERQRELGRIKDDFVANVSHELRTPLTTVVGNTEMLLDGDAGALSPAQERLLRAIDRNARRLQTPGGGPLMPSRGQNGPVTPRAPPPAMQGVVQTARAARAAAP